jgi:hypothetical protein
MWFDGGKFRIDRVDGDGDLETAIVKDQTFYAVDHDRKTYTVMDKAAMQKMGDQFASMRRQLEEQMAGMPPEQRGVVDEMLKRQGGAAAGAKAAPLRTVRDTERSEKLDGRSCRVWELLSGTEKREEWCVVPPGAIPSGAEIMQSMRLTGEMFRDLAERFGSDVARTADASWSEIEKVNGVPILARRFENGKVVEETRTTALREEPVPASRFDPPPGFKQRTLRLGVD